MLAELAEGVAVQVERAFQPHMSGCWLGVDGSRGLCRLGRKRAQRSASDDERVGLVGEGTAFAALAGTATPTAIHTLQLVNPLEKLLTVAVIRLLDQPVKGILIRHRVYHYLLPVCPILTINTTAAFICIVAATQTASDNLKIVIDLRMNSQLRFINIDINCARTCRGHILKKHISCRT